MRTASNTYFLQTMSVIPLPESDTGLAARVSQHRDRLKAVGDLGALANFRMIPELAAAFADVPIKDAKLEIFDKGDARIGEDDPRSGVLRRDPGPRRVELGWRPATHMERDCSSPARRAGGGTRDSA